MKKLFVLTAVLLSLVIPLVACAMGPIYNGAKTATWDAVTGVTGYYIYWRTPGTTTWPNAQRAMTNAVTLDLVAAGVPQGSWEICATAFDALSESGPSNVVTWSYTIKGAPANTKIQ